VRRYVATIAGVHVAAGLLNPCSSEAVRLNPSIRPYPSSSSVGVRSSATDYDRTDSKGVSDQGVTPVGIIRNSSAASLPMTMRLAGENFGDGVQRRTRARKAAYTSGLSRSSMQSSSSWGADRGSQAWMSAPSMR
jgi:hypothetical protein